MVSVDEDWFVTCFVCFVGVVAVEDVVVWHVWFISMPCFYGLG